MIKLNSKQFKNPITGTFEGIFSGNGEGVTGVVTASYSVTSSYASNAELLDGKDSLYFTSTGSFNSFTSSYYQDSASFSSSISSNKDNIQLLSTFTGSYATTGSNTFNGNQIISGSLSISGSDYTNTSASFDTRILENSASITLLSGSYLFSSGGFSTRISTLENFSSSLDAAFASVDQLNSATASLSSSIAILSSSYLESSQSFNTNIQSLIDATSSYIVNSQTGSFVTTESFHNFTSSYTTASFTGSYTGDGGGLYNIPASGIVGLNLNAIVSGSVSASISPDNGLQINTNVNAPSFTGSLFGTASWAESASFAPNYLPLTGGTISGNLNVIGTASFAYTTASIVQVGSSTIILNTDAPAVRFGGISVIDSGSFGNSSTGSLLWDSLNNKWLYSNPSGSSYDGGMLISGPRNTSGLGNETGMDNNFVAVGQGSDHIRPGSIFNSGSITIVTGSLTVTQGISGSFSGSGADLSNIPASAIVGLNLNQISSGSVSASISPDNGLLINTNVTATSFTGSIFGTASFATLAHTASYVLQAVSSSYAATASYVAGASSFPFTGSAAITGSLIVTGSVFATSFIGDGAQLTGIQRTRQFDYSGSYSYQGSAPSGSSVSSSVWNISRVEIFISGTVDTKNAFNVAWSDRYSASYS